MLIIMIYVSLQLHYSHLSAIYLINGLLSELLLQLLSVLLQHLLQ